MVDTQLGCGRRRMGVLSKWGWYVADGGVELKGLVRGRDAGGSMKRVGCGCQGVEYRA